MNLSDLAINFFKSFFKKNNSIDVNLQDQTSEIIDLHLIEIIQPITIINNTSIDDTSIVISCTVEPTNGNSVCLKEGSAFYQGEILSHSANGGNWNIELDVPLDFAYTVNGGCSEVNQNLAVDGSLTKRIFRVSPSGLGNGVKWDITRIMGVIIDDVEMDDGKFGGIPALTRGIFARKVDGTAKNIFNAKTNGDLAAHMYDVSYSEKAKQGEFGLRFRRSFAGQDKNGVVIRLEADTDDELQIIIQDDLTDLILFNVIAQGHVVED